jgi:hypothetical protein
MHGDYYKWSEFTEDVMAYLPVDKDRVGAEEYIQRLLTQGVLDLQFHIVAYRKLHETIYTPSDFSVQGCAAKATLPPGAVVRDAWLFHIDSQTTLGLWDFEWARRNELIYGTQLVPRICIAPDTHTFHVYPIPSAGWLVSLWWDGMKSEFQPEEELPFPKEDKRVSMAVAEFIKGKLAREVQKDMGLYESFFHPRLGSYSVARRDLYLTAQARGVTKYGTRGLAPEGGGSVTIGAEVSPTTAQGTSQVSSGPLNYLQLKDAVTGGMVQLTIKDGQISIVT